MPREISERAIDLIITEEVGSKELYISRYQHPEWPGVNSGVTVGIGYDLGYKTPQEIQNDWGGILPQNIIEYMKTCVGKTGQSAANYIHNVKQSIVVPWDAAIEVFRKKNLPYWIGLVEKALPNFDLLSPDSAGALVSLAYNRGAGGFNISNKNGYREMYNIKLHMINKEFTKIPQEFRSQKRLWTSKGLINRREKEAILFEQGLKPLEETSGFF